MIEKQNQICTSRSFVIVNGRKTMLQNMKNSVGKGNCEKRNWKMLVDLGSY